MDSKKIEYLIVDTGAFIKNAPIQDLADTVITCPEVINEVTSKRQMRRLVVLPYELEVKDVFPENLKFVTEFSKKTGDYPSLSATDLKVIALTYQFEIEKVGIDHLKTAPEAQRTITFQNRPTVDPKDVAGFFLPSSKTSTGDGSDSGPEEISEALSEKFSSHHEQTPADQITLPSSNHDIQLSAQEENVEVEETESESGSEPGDGQSLEEVDPSSVLVKVNDPNLLSNDMENTNLNSSDDEDSENDDCNDDDEEDNDDSDEGGWITPGNIRQAKKQMNAEFEEEKPVKVACITTDFAMQNVLKQIGLNVASVDGRIIKQLRTFILRCYACFKTTSIMTKVFCPHCGHKTLKRVAVSVEPDGSQKIHINLKKRLTTRGKKFSMPTFQGGKHANNPIIFADQPVPDQRPSHRALMKTNILDEDYIPGFSPFAARDTTSKSAMLGIRGNKEMKHWMQRNPNESKPHSRRKKK